MDRWSFFLSFQVTSSMEDDDDDQRLLHSLGVTSADIHDIERRIISQVRYAMQCTLLSLSLSLTPTSTTHPFHISHHRYSVTHAAQSDRYLHSRQQLILPTHLDQPSMEVISLMMLSPNCITNCALCKLKLML